MDGIERKVMGLMKQRSDERKEPTSLNSSATQ